MITHIYLTTHFNRCTFLPHLPVNMTLQGSISSTFYIHAAFMRAEPKSIKKTLKSSVFLRFRNLCAQKLHVNMLVKLTPGANTTTASALLI